MPDGAQTLLGFDYGTSKIGVAVGQMLTRTATPLTTLLSVKSKPDWDRINQLIHEWQPEALVVGLPLKLDDSATEMTEPARKFARQLQGRYQLPVHMADERLSSREAWSRIGGKAVHNVRQIDAMAAKLILETWLSVQS